MVYFPPFSLVLWGATQSVRCWRWLKAISLILRPCWPLLRFCSLSVINGPQAGNQLCGIMATGLNLDQKNLRLPLHSAMKVCGKYGTITVFQLYLPHKIVGRIKEMYPCQLPWAAWNQRGKYIQWKISSSSSRFSPSYGRTIEEWILSLVHMHISVKNTICCRTPVFQIHIQQTE